MQTLSHCLYGFVVLCATGMPAAAQPASAALRQSSAEAAPASAQVWQRWDHALASTRPYGNPYADLTLKVTYTGPAGRTIRAYGFWDGGDTFRIRCAFPAPGVWRWETECSDTANAGLHAQRGAVEVAPSASDHPLYRRGFLKVSQDRRHLAYSDGTPFLWIGDTAWAVPQKASDPEWQTYLADRAAKHFTLVQVAPAPRWAGDVDRRGEKPFTDKSCAQWNPAYWQAFDRKVERANQRGLVVLLVGLMEPVDRYPASDKACLFARNIVARLFGDFVIFSPSFDSEYRPLADEVGRAARAATSVHLITQHPGTPWNEPTPTFSVAYYDRPYLDIAGVQTGHNGGNRQWCAHHAIEWNLHLYRHEPHKPVINLEAMYDGQGEKGWQAIDARSLAWRSWLSGAMGYTYGAGDLPPKCPKGSGAVWMWVTDPAKYDYWEKALQWESAFQMRYLHDFLVTIDWWRLEPAHELIRNQPDDVTRRMVLAKTAAGDVAVTYLPDNDAVEVDMSAFPAPLAARWFDPVRGGYTSVEGTIENQGTHRFAPPAKGDWVLLLERPRTTTSAAGAAVPAWFPKAPPLPPPQGEVIRADTADELLAAVDRLAPGGTILLADGHYKLPRTILLNEKKNVAIRSASGDPAKVVLSGKGWDSRSGDDILHISHCEGVTLADLTFTDCRSYGVKVEAENGPKDVHVYNCRFRDIGVRAIKGSAGQDPNLRAVKGSVRYCTFENTKVPPADWLFGGDYIAAIDMMALEDWTFSDNVFRNVRGRNGGGRAAIFIWVRSRRVVVQRNLIVNCDRGIAFGNPGQATANRAGERLVYVADGIIRNNFIAGGADCGIELWYADRIKVLNNSIWRPERNWSRGIRIGTGTASTQVVNNLVHGEIRLEGGEAQLSHNHAGRLDGYFLDPAAGQLELTASAKDAIGQGVSLPEVTDDIRGRPRSGQPDLGAWKFERE